MEKSDFAVMQQLATTNTGIRMSPHFVSANLNKKGGHVTMGVDSAIIHDLMTGKYVCALYVLDKDQFFKIKKECPVSYTEMLVAGLQIILKYDPEAQVLFRRDGILCGDQSYFDDMPQDEHDYMSSIGWYIHGTYESWYFNP